MIYRYVRNTNNREPLQTQTQSQSLSHNTRPWLVGLLTHSLTHSNSHTDVFLFPPRRQGKAIAIDVGPLCGLGLGATVAWWEFSLRFGQGGLYIFFPGRFGLEGGACLGGGGFCSSVDDLSVSRRWSMSARVESMLFSQYRYREGCSGKFSYALCC